MATVSASEASLLKVRMRAERSSQSYFQSNVDQANSECIVFQFIIIVINNQAIFPTQPVSLIQVTLAFSHLKFQVQQQRVFCFVLLLAVISILLQQKLLFANPIQICLDIKTSPEGELVVQMAFTDVCIKSTFERNCRNQIIQIERVALVLQYIKAMEQTNPPNQNSYVQVKGLSWLLSKQNSTHESSSGKENKMLRFQQQSKKWKKHVSNRFEGYSKTIEKFIQSQFKRQSEKQSHYEYDSLRKTQSKFKHKERQSMQLQSEKDRRKEFQNTIFNLKRKERDIYNEFSKMKKLKKTSEICQKKKNFYDGCVDEYFQNYSKQINQTITRLAERSVRDSRAKISFS